ncbi:MAG TPA: DUF4388 domain-containing protein, partial [Vicinamibacteria bacterium]|nr:DUF4388 domain-containing protein [Vicinamibacteria bacterium]
LRELQAERATGILSLTSGGARKALYLKAGRVVFAASNLPSDRLGEVLLREGKISPEQNESSVRGLAQGRRQGRVLVEAGALSPDELWWAVQTQVREIVFSVFQWDEGQFHFEESVLPEKEKITVDLDVTALVLEGVRRMDLSGSLRGRQPDGYLVIERGDTSAEGLLHPWEQHVLSLVDGQKGVLELCHESEVGEGQTLKALYAFLCTGIVRSRGRKVRALDQDFVPEDTALTVLDSFNRMYRHVLAYMVKEVGPIAENVLAKYLNTVRESRPEVLQEVALRKDGSLDEAAVERNLTRLPEDARRVTLVDALNELLYAELLAVKRTLGADHETAIVRDLRPPR